MVWIMVAKEIEDDRVAAELVFEEGKELGVCDVADVTEEGEIGGCLGECVGGIGGVGFEVEIGHYLEADAGHDG